MPIPTKEEMSVIVRDAVGSHLSSQSLKDSFNLWPKKPRVCPALVELELCVQNEDGPVFCKIAIYRPSSFEGCEEWGEVGILINTHVYLTYFGKHMLRLTLIQEILKKIRTDVTAFRNS